MNHRVAAPLRALALACIVGALAIVSACARPQASAGPPPIDAAILRDAATIPGDFLARQRVSGAMNGHTLSSEVVLQKRGDTLTLLGLTPFGTRAFAVLQEGLEVRVESPTPEALPFPPALMLVDVHRALFVGERPQADGVHRWRLAGERVIETWSGGRLLRREFLRRRRPRGRITIDYGEGYVGAAPPPSITITNEALGYTVTIETVSFQALDAPNEAAATPRNQ